MLIPTWTHMLMSLPPRLSKGKLTSKAYPFAFPDHSKFQLFFLYMSLVDVRANGGF